MSCLKITDQKTPHVNMTTQKKQSENLRSELASNFEDIENENKIMIINTYYNQPETANPTHFHTPLHF